MISEAIRHQDYHTVHEALLDIARYHANELGVHVYRLCKLPDSLPLRELMRIHVLDMI